MYSAITIDTSIFESNGLKLEAGLLAKLSQFRDGPSRVIISEIVLNELKNHLVKKTTDVIRKLNSSIEDVDDHLVFADVAEQVKAIKITPDAAMAIVEERLNRFMENAGVLVIPVDGNLDVNNLLEAYFQNKPPFEEVGKKKAEFPDALALHSMDKWAKDKDRKIIAVSGDKGWAQYAKLSEGIDVVSDLADGIAKLQPHNRAFKFCEQLAEDLPHGNADKIVESLEAFVDNYVANMDVYADASACHQFDCDYVECTFTDLEVWKRRGKAMIMPVEASEDSIVVVVKVIVYGEATGDFNFYVYDSIDKEDVGIGSCEATTEFEFDTDILFKIKGDFDKGINELEIDEFEVLLMPPSTIDFGTIEPDYGYDYDEDNDYDEPDEEPSQSDQPDLKF